MKMTVDDSFRQIAILKSFSPCRPAQWAGDAGIPWLQKSESADPYSCVSISDRRSPVLALYPHPRHHHSVRKHRHSKHMANFMTMCRMKLSSHNVSQSWRQHKSNNKAESQIHRLQRTLSPRPKKAEVYSHLVLPCSLGNTPVKDSNNKGL